jgi:hypothetical protein
MLRAAHSQVKPIVGFQFVALPVELLRRTDLSPAAKLLVAVVMDSARGSRAGSCRLTNEALGARIGRSAASVKRLLAELEAVGVVRRDTVAEGRVRTAVTPTWVAQSCATEQASAAQNCDRGGAESIHPAAQNRATIQNLPSEPTIQTGPILSVSGGEKTEPKPSPAEIAAAMRAMVAGKYAPTIWSSVQPTQSPPRPAASNPRRTTVEPTAAPPRDVHELARGIFVDARRAAYAACGGRRQAARNQEALAAWRECSPHRNDDFLDFSKSPTP